MFDLSIPESLHLRCVTIMYNSQNSDSSKKLILDQAGKRLVDSVIKQRLAAEMPLIRNNVQQLIKASDPFKDRRDKLREVVVKRRKISVSVSDKDRARKTLSFVPFPDESNDIQEFDLRRRVHESPLVDYEQGEELNKARISHDNLYVRMGQLTKAKYEDDPRRASAKAYESLQPSLNIAGKHYVVSVLDEEVLPRRSLSQQLTVQHSFIKEKPEDHDTIQVYQPKKFNKVDMKSLDGWFNDSFQRLLNQKPKLSDKQFLHHLFGLYICSFKEFIRLTYVDSIDKAILLEKLIFSFITVFDNMMDLQHKINYKQFKEYRHQFNQMKDMFEQREVDIIDKLEKLQNQYAELNKKYNRLVVVHASYRKINRELVYEVEEYGKLARELRQAHQHLKFDHHKLLKELEETGKIGELNNKYYIINHYSSPEIITNFITGPDEYQKFMAQVDRVEPVQSDLTKFWAQVEDDFAIAKMMPTDDLFPKTNDVCIQSQNIFTFFEDVGIQNYSLHSHLSDISMNSADGFENFLQKELNQQKNQREEEQSALVISLRELYDQVYHENLKIKSTNKRLSDNLVHEAEYNASLLKEMTQLRQKDLWQEAVVKQTRLQIDGLFKQNAQKDSTINHQKERLSNLEYELKCERFNNEVFVKNEMQLRKKIEKMDRQNSSLIKDLESQIKTFKIKILKGVAVFNDYLDLVEYASDKRYIEIGAKIEEIFKDDLNRQQKDISPFITK